MGKRPSSNPEAMRNVPRSKVGKAAPMVGEYLWTDDPGEMQMVQTSITAAGHLANVVESERSESVSSTAPLAPTKRRPEDPVYTV